MLNIQNQKVNGNLTRRTSNMKEEYKFIVISDEPKHPIPRLQVECRIRNDIPEDIKDYIFSLKSDYIKEEN